MLFGGFLGKGKENQEGGYRSQHASPDRRPATSSSNVPISFSQAVSTQETVASSFDDVFSQPQTQSTQATQSFGQSFAQSFKASENERRETGDSFVSAKEFGSKDASNEDLHAKHEEEMELEDDAPVEPSSDAPGTTVHHNISSDHEMVIDEIPDFPQPPARFVSEQYNVSLDTQEALETADERAQAPEPKTLFAPTETFSAPAEPELEPEEVQHDDTVVHHDVDDQMEIDDDVRSPSDGSSPVKPLVRKSSLTFSSLPAREPLLAKKSMGNRTSRTSHVDPSKARGSTLGRFTGGKSLGGSQVQQPESQQEVSDDEEQPEAQREESEATKIHNKTSSQRLLERINMLKQQNEAPKRISQNILASQMSQTSQTSFASSQMKESAQSSQNSQSAQPQQMSQPSYPSLPDYPTLPAEHQIEDDDDDWISPVQTAPANPPRPTFSKSHSAQVPPSPGKAALPKPISVSNPDFPSVEESTTPVGSPTGKRNMDGPLSASKAKFYSALRAAKEKIIGSSATSAQVKLDALVESPVRKAKDQISSDDVFSSPKRSDKASIFSHLRSPSKESLKSTKSKNVPSSPAKESRRTRSSSEREKQKDKDSREKQRMDDRLKEMREKEQTKASAHHQRNKPSTSKSAMASQQSIRPTAPNTLTKTPTAAVPQPPRPGPSRANTTRSNEDSADEMPPPPPPKSFLPMTGQKLREPRKIETKKLQKPTSKEAMPKAKPQKIMVSLHNSRYGQAPPTASKHAAPAPTPVTAAPVAAKPAPTVQRMGPPAPKAAPAAPTRPASALSTKAASSYKPVSAKSAPRVGRPPVQKPAEKPIEKPKAPQTQSRGDLGAARPVSRMQTIQDANRIQAPPINPAKPAKRPFQEEHSETLQRPAKRPSQLAKMNPMNPITPGPSHAQFAKGKIPFAEPTPSTQKSVPQYQNGEEIKLPEIMTDSEDEDSDNDFEQPSWVNTPNLRELLTQQQLVDPEQVFGPIAPLNMEQVFPNKERHKRFRERTSSAYWVNDQVTEEERRKDREAKERLFREGAWTYNPSPRPTGTQRPGH